MPGADAKGAGCEGGAAGGGAECGELTRCGTDREKYNDSGYAAMGADEIIRVTAAIIRHSSKVLLARRRTGSHLEGLWEFPGGKIELGETPEECLARELREEFELEATVGAFVASSCYRYGQKEIELLAYEVELGPGQLILNSHDEVRWVPVKDLCSIDLAPADVPIAKQLTRRMKEVDRGAGLGTQSR